MKIINIKAIAAGVLVDLIGFLFFAALIMILVSMVVYGKGIQADAALIQNTMKIINSNEFLVGFLLLGIFMNFIGGVLAGQIAKRSEIAHACLVGTVILLVGLAIPSSTPSTYPAWFTWTTNLLIFPAVILGGVVSIKFKYNSFLSINLKEKLWILNGVIIFCFYQAIMLIGRSYITREDIILSSIESILWISVAIGLINKNNFTRIALTVWLGLEIVLNIDQLSHLSKLNLTGIVSMSLFICSRAFVIYYLRRKAIALKFTEDAPDVN